MFGGAGIYRDGIMFGLVADGRIYLRIDDESRQTFEEAGSEPFVYAQKKKAVTLPYWSLPDAALDDGDTLKSWADLAFRSALNVKRREKPR